MENEADETINPEYKDRLFKFIFGQDTEQSKRWRLQLYNALNGTCFTDPDELEINTIENVVYISMHNDISFLVDTEMNLFEEQSSYNPNMPLRGLIYFGILYQKYLIKNQENLISSSRVMIPTPKFYVFYHGGPKQADRWEMKLSDSFLKEDNSGAYQWTATIINLHPNHNATLNKNCIPLYHYVEFVSMITANKKAGLENKEAIVKAVSQAIQEKLLEGFFKIHRAEVIGMCLEEISEEEQRRIWHRDGYSEGLNKGEQKGRSEKAVEDARNFYSNGASIELIAKSLNMTLEEVQLIVKDVEVLQQGI